ncbi:MAG TPA: ABC transporter permease subunit [Chloroflexia bacterium]|nr:ABC transporter permease subunit [Chloroflexia bacterium]
MAVNVEARSRRPVLRRLPEMAAGGWRALRYNPIIIKELRHRMRSWHGLIDLALCTLVLVAFGLINYSTVSGSSYRYYISYSSSYGSSYVSRNQDLGTTYFIVIVVAQLFLACVIAPGFSSSTIAEEKERQTYDVLLVTLLRPRDIIIGKLFSSLAYLLLVTIAGIPVSSVAFLMGGVGLDQLFAALIIMLFTGLVVGSIGIYWSAAMRTAREANRNTFLNLLILLFAIPIGAFLATQFFGVSYFNSFPIYGDTPGRDIMSWICSINPMYAVLSLSEILKNRSGSNIFYYFNIGGEWIISPFIRFILISSFLSGLYIWRATKRIKPLRLEGDRRVQRGKSKTKPAQAERTVEVES